MYRITDEQLVINRLQCIASSTVSKCLACPDYAECYSVAAQEALSLLNIKDLEINTKRLSSAKLMDELELLKDAIKSNNSSFKHAQLMPNYNTMVLSYCLDDYNNYLKSVQTSNTEYVLQNIKLLLKNNLNFYNTNAKKLLSTDYQSGYEEHYKDVMQIIDKVLQDVRGVK